MSKMCRVNISMTEEDLELVDYFCKKTGLSRSSFCLSLLKRSMDDLAKAEVKERRGGYCYSGKD